MNLSNLKPAKNSKHRKKIIGRGVGSGHGRTSTRGTKGQKSRTGDGSKKIGFEGGQMPIFRRVPKRGFNNSMFRKKYEIVNVSSLNKFEIGTEITPSVLKDAGIIQKKFVKILAVGDITKPLTVTANAFSKAAIKKIESSGGKVKNIR
ncbi:MAG: 50S ribosomal protein L15 [Endomicrobium sp.]|nr:50S ribosomal protein L15 [Endomicrobium sp.]